MYLCALIIAPPNRFERQTPLVCGQTLFDSIDKDASGAISISEIEIAVQENQVFRKILSGARASRPREPTAR